MASRKRSTPSSAGTAGAGPRYVSKRTKACRAQCDALPARVLVLAQDAFKRFKANPFDPSLDNHDLEDNRRGRHRKGSRAVSVSLRYRAIYFLDETTTPTTAVWYWIGSHEDYNAFTGSRRR